MALKTTITELPESRVRVQAEVPADEVEQRVQEAARQLGRQMRIPGFRKGKVPPPVVIRRLGRDQLLELGTGRLLPGFDEQLTAASAGETRSIPVKFPDDYPGELAGKEAQFEVTVTEVKAKRLPQLDDEFASTAGGFDTLTELREDIDNRLSQADAAAVGREFEQAVMDAAVAEATIEVPPKLVHARAHELLSQTLQALARQGISKEAYLRISGKDEEALAREAEPEAEAIIKREAVLAAVVQAEGIEPSDEQLLDEIRPVREREGRNPEKVLEQLRSRSLD